MFFLIAVGGLDDNDVDVDEAPLVELTDELVVDVGWFVVFVIMLGE